MTSDVTSEASPAKPALPPAHRIVFANEKGGTGKSTTAVHVAIALAHLGAKVAAIDLDPRQRTLHRYLENRAETAAKRQVSLPSARFEVFGGTTVAELDSLCDALGAGVGQILGPALGPPEDEVQGHGRGQGEQGGAQAGQDMGEGAHGNLR